MPAKMINMKRIIIIVLIVVFTGLLFSCNTKREYLCPAYGNRIQQDINIRQEYKEE